MEKERTVTKVKTYTVTLTYFDDNTFDMKRTNEGYINPLELMGLSDFIKLEVYEQILGRLKPDTITRQVVVDDEEVQDGRIKVGDWAKHTKRRRPFSSNLTEGKLYTIIQVDRNNNRFFIKDDSGAKKHFAINTINFTFSKPPSVYTKKKAATHYMCMRLFSFNSETPYLRPKKQRSFTSPCAPNDLPTLPTSAKALNSKTPFDFCQPTKAFACMNRLAPVPIKFMSLLI